MLIILIHNDATGDEKIGNYTYEVRVNTDVIDGGEIKGHVREEGWRKLLMMIVEDKPV